jgi:hypothetical protein
VGGNGFNCKTWCISIITHLFPVRIIFSAAADRSIDRGPRGEVYVDPGGLEAYLSVNDVDISCEMMCWLVAEPSAHDVQLHKITTH